MFKSAVFKLTASYLAVLMVLSVFFSFLIFNLSTNEFSRRLEPGMGLQTGPQFLRINTEATDFIREQVEESQKAVVINLIFTNLVILVLGGFLSYILARRTLRPIELAHQSLERFTADASHELRTPLTAMKSEIEVAIKTGKLNKKLLRSNLEEIDKLTVLSDSLLKLARMDNKIHKDEINLKKVVEQAVNRCLIKAEEKSILLEPYLKDTKINGNKDMIGELAIILIENAIKYSPENTKIQITTSEGILAVKDEGRGIKATEVLHIFERFYRGDASRSTNGYGLGLAIAKQIADLHGAKIEVESQPSKGSTFTVKF